MGRLEGGRTARARVRLPIMATVLRGCGYSRRFSYFSSLFEGRDSFYQFGDTCPKAESQLSLVPRVRVRPPHGGPHTFR